jgi:hypothetical protein
MAQNDDAKSHGYALAMAKTIAVDLFTISMDSPDNIRDLEIAGKLKAVSDLLEHLRTEAIGKHRSHHWVAGICGSAIQCLNIARFPYTP